VEIDGAGTVRVNGEQTDVIQLVAVANPLALEKVGHNYFRPRAAGAAEELPAEGAVVEQGYLEAPNVEIVEEMVNMIEAQRAFEAYAKTIQTAREADDKSINQVGAVR
jgi:flagellar basal-body rod protein FlgG